MTQFYIVGILNVTPDSFYDGGRYTGLDQSLKRAEQMIEEGADVLDVGGESTRPGSERISQEEEIKRVIPVIEMLSKRCSVPISIDTYKAEVAKQALEAGATWVNDISGLTMDKHMGEVVSQKNAKVVITHLLGTPKDMQLEPVYQNVVEDIRVFFKKQLNLAKEYGVDIKNIILDPGIGFGKTVEHNLVILNHLSSFLTLGCPLMVGTSRKSFIGKILKDKGPEDRLAGSLATAVYGLFKGVTYFRVHDVLETKRALTVMSHILSEG
ncbi:MAG: dihydropteroate synthase [Deltaproteobacteria bacterium GWA2_38_16]|nr:MAG: dihydropteroate synthase [Deltaproteobacteria bacterium GWA2_38_16]OGQ03066.1 MAG: dihydropteroate synthase [Deltaproteobacteria bacterium RIFCSPHIGHO2_02_FULL_38_15]OGQ34965.1 MAG: dihydropteroate synthase [Deltaproteobacteria bacterium RIFCSPLOWO2_01_FULL_38_9]OGQ61838.1 MAG: dihydropteroate synthase [Deltaproteobacteria bacterium RIFCSPLOWO2_12_FULL_38_8]HBQ20517.1 dihydropteroate synthase [Deltaproteobacteria bacterium]